MYSQRILIVSERRTVPFFGNLASSMDVGILGEEYFPEDIIDKKNENGEEYYLINWYGYPGEPREPLATAKKTLSMISIVITQ